MPPGKTLKKDCFLISGAKVTEGVGEYVVIAVGTKSFNGRLMMGEFEFHSSDLTSRAG